MNAHSAAQRGHPALIKHSGKGDLYTWAGDIQQRGLAASTMRQRANLVRAWLGQHIVIALVQDALSTRNERLIHGKRVESDMRLHGIAWRSGYE